MTDLLDDLQWRGIVAQTTDEEALRRAFAEGLTFYCGFDPTAPSLHMGNLVQLITMRRLQQAGQKPIGLVGGATGLIGDPSGKNAERSLNEVDVVESWVERIRGQVERYLDFDGANAATIVNNLDWAGRMSAIDLLRDVGKHFPVNRMLDREAVSARLAAGGISYTEFSYQVLQAMDYLELYQRHGCTLQTGGSDQWGNITAGVDLVRRVTGGHVHALSTQLLLKSDGTKFGKTAEGAIWLDPDRTSPYAFFQFLLNSDDADVVRLLKVFSFRPRAEIEELATAVSERPAAREAQRALAEELTDLVHGAAERKQAESAGRALFGKADLQELTAQTLQAALDEAGVVEVAAGESTVTDLLVATGLCASRSAARRTVSDGGAYLNNDRIEDPELVPNRGQALAGEYLVLRRGKRHVAGVRLLG